MFKKSVKILSFLILIFIGISFVFINKVQAAFVQEQHILASDGVVPDDFGVGVSISSDGTRLAIGADDVGSQNGAIYIFVRSGNTWVEEQKLQISDPQDHDQFGFSVSISADGSRVVSGTSNKNGARGAVYVFSRSGTVWTQEQKLTASDGAINDQFGGYVSISSDGTRLIAGATGVSMNSGAAYVFSRSGTVWTQEQKLTASDGAIFSFFGFSVDMFSDGTRLAIGTLAREAVYVFSRSGTVWTQEQKLTASDGVASDGFGIRVSASGDGVRLAIGASNAGGKGAAYVFSRSGTVWTQEQKLTASDGVASDSFGNFIRFSFGGDLLGITASSADEDAGAVYVFSKFNNTWNEVQKLVKSNAEADDNFGSSVSVSSDGSIFVVGAKFENNILGGAYSYILNPILDSIFPSSVFVGNADFTITVMGADFLTSSVIKWNNSSLATTYVSSTELTAVVPASNVLNAGTALITVSSPTIVGISEAQTLTINNLTPIITSISPTFITAKGSQFTLTTTGTNFISDSVINWNGTSLTTTYVSSTELSAIVPIENIIDAGSVNITVTNPAPGGGTTDPQVFTINSVPSSSGSMSTKTRALKNKNIAPPTISQITPPVVTYNFGTTTLRRGSTGEAVKELQRFLNTKLNLSLVVDGIFGPKTLVVIKQWQKDKGLVVDGLVGPLTKAKMNLN